MYHSCTSKTTSIIKTIKGASPLPTLHLEEGVCAPIFVSFIFIDNSSMIFIRTFLIIFYKKVSFRYPLHAVSIVFTTRKTLIVNNPILLNFKTLPVFINIFLKI